jgi:hypothetical protein
VSDPKEHMTVNQLITALSKLDPTDPVWIMEDDGYAPEGYKWVSPTIVAEFCGGVFIE